MAALSPVPTYHSAPHPAINPTKSDISAQGRVVVITGGGSGIGQAVARAFARAGSTRIAVLGRNQTALETTKVNIEKDHTGCSVLPVVADIVEIESVRAAFGTIVLEFGPIDVLINNAGYINNLSLWADADIGDWWRCYEVNVKGSMNVIRTFLSPGTFSTHASVINISTGSAHILMAGQGPYGSSKMASAKLFETLQMEKPDMQVINVHPGVVQTAMGMKPFQQGQKLGANAPWDDAELSANFVVWATSPRAHFLRGRFVWANWDTVELEAMEAEIKSQDKFVLGLNGFPRVIVPLWSPNDRTKASI